MKGILHASVSLRGILLADAAAPLLLNWGNQQLPHLGVPTGGLAATRPAYKVGLHLLSFIAMGFDYPRTP
jgi:hypothetical protein